MKLTKLTDEQLALLPQQRDKWLKIGLSTEPLDFEKAKAAVVDVYRIAGLEPPKFFYRFQSPLSAAIGATMLKKGGQVGDQVWDQVWDQVRAQVRAQVWDQVRAQVGNQVRDQVGDQVWAQVWDQVGAQVGDQVRDQVGDQVRDQVRAQVGDQVRDQVRAQVWDQVRAQVGDQVRDQVRAQVWDQVGAQVGDQVRAQVGAQVWAQVGDQVWDQVGAQVWAQVFGCHDAAWLAFHETFLLFGIDAPKRLLPLMELAKHCGWWAPYKNAAILQDRPVKISFDDQNRLHCEDGPAVLYRDDFAVYSWHGTRIPKEWIEKKPTAQQAITWGNLEQRRAACEIVGWAEVLKQLNAKVINSDSNPQIGDLLEVDIPDIGREKFLKVLCGTGREFALPVPPEMRTALEANAWTYGLDANDYNPEVRT